MGTNAWDTFVLRVEHPYIVGKPLDMGESTFHAEKNCMLSIAAANQSACFSPANHSRNCTKSTQLASFPGRFRLQFLIACSMQKWRGNSNGKGLQAIKKVVMHSFPPSDCNSSGVFVNHVALL